jgi:hypothetical protein
VPDAAGVPAGGPFNYRDDVIAHLWRHGIHPTPHTPPELVRDFVRDLYKYEIRRLRASMLSNEFPRAEYAGRVDQLRRQYMVLSLLPRQFLA